MKGGEVGDGGPGLMEFLVGADDGAAALAFFCSSPPPPPPPPPTQILSFAAAAAPRDHSGAGEPTSLSPSPTSTVTCSSKSTSFPAVRTAAAAAARRNSGDGAGGGVPVTATASKKKPRTTRARKEKLGERIAALHEIVSPFGKTDTASVLHEALGYIRFLHDQVQVLISPYLQQHRLPPPPANVLRDHEVEGGSNSGGGEDLWSRGLCLVPVSCTDPIVAGAGGAVSNGADLWYPASPPAAS